MPAGLGGSLLVALNTLTPIPTTDGGRSLLHSRLVDSLDAYFYNQGLPVVEPFAIRSTVLPYSRPGSITIHAVGRVSVYISERNKELIRKRTDIGEHFTRDVIQSIVFIFLPLAERVHLTKSASD